MTDGQFQQPATDAGDEVRPRRLAVGSVAIRRVAILLLLSQLTLFTKGCDNGKFQFTLGPAAPYATFTFHDDRLLPLEGVDFSTAMFALNVILSALAAAGLLAWPRARSFLLRRTLWLSMTICVTIFSAFLFGLGAVWMSLVFAPTANLMDFLEKRGLAPLLSVHVIARLYFVACVVLVDGLLVSAAWFARRYVIVTPARWWQWRLGGLILLMVLTGLALGLIVGWQHAR